MIGRCTCFFRMKSNLVSTKELSFGLLLHQSLCLYYYSRATTVPSVNVYWICQYCIFVRASNSSLRHWQQMGGVSIQEDMIIDKSIRRSVDSRASVVKLFHQWRFIIKAESTSSNNSVSETEVMKKKITSPNVKEVHEAEVHQPDLGGEIVPETVMVKQTDSCHFVAEVQQKELNHATGQEPNMLLQKESLAATDQELYLHCETSHVPSYLTVEAYQHADSTVSTDVVLQEAMVEKTASQSSITVSHLEKNGVQEQKTEYYFSVNRPDYPSIDAVLETGLVQEHIHQSLHIMV